MLALTTHDECFDELEDHDRSSRFFSNNYGLKEHYLQLQAEPHHYCSPCDKPSQNDAFISNSALVLHLESGAWFIRHIVNGVVRQLDTNHNRYPTAASWNGSAYKCFYATVSSSLSLNQHLASAAHRESSISVQGRIARFVLSALVYSASTLRVRVAVC